MSIRRAFSLVVVVGLLAHGVAAQNPCNPCNPCSPKNACNPCNPCGGANPCGGKAMAVNPCAAKMGTVFHVSDPMGRNSVTFTSEAPLEDIIGTTSDVQGYLVFDPKHPDKGGMGEFVVPVASLVTGIPLRDEHLRSAAWLDAGRYPEIRFHIDGARSVRMVNETRTAQTWNMKLHGTLTLHGKTQPMGATARVTYMRESDQTRQKMPGDLLAARATLEVPLKDFGVTGPPGAGIVGSKVSDSIEITVRLLGSTHQMAGANPCGGNPCNPCGGKNPCNPYARSANPCNPCGGR